MPENIDWANAARAESMPPTSDELSNANQHSSLVLCYALFRLLQIGSLTRGAEIRKEAARRAEHHKEKAVDLLMKARLLRVTVGWLIQGDPSADQLKIWCEDADDLLMRIDQKIFKVLKPLRNGHLQAPHQTEICQAYFDIHTDATARVNGIRTILSDSFRNKPPISFGKNF